MMQILLTSTLITCSFIFMKMNHPLSMGLMLLMQTTTICLYIGMMYKTFWFSYILFLILLGGMLVLFIYMVALASNETFSFSTKLMTMTSLMLLLTMFIMMMINKMYNINMFNNNEMMMLNELNSYIKEDHMSLNKLYNYPTNLTTILLMNYLLITLIAVVKITNLFFGPLRMTN